MNRFNSTFVGIDAVWWPRASMPEIAETASIAETAVSARCVQIAHIAHITQIAHIAQIALTVTDECRMAAVLMWNKVPSDQCLRILPSDLTFYLVPIGANNATGVLTVED